MKTLILKNKETEIEIVKKGFVNMKSNACKHQKRFNAIFALMLMIVSFSGFAQSNLESVEHSSNLDGSVEFRLRFDGEIAKPEVFMTARPARLAFDMEGVYNNSGVKLLPVSKGNTKSLRIVSASTKTRAVIDLYSPAHHELEVNGNELVVKIASGANIAKTMNEMESKYAIENVDFRRGKEGQGKVVITFNKPGALVNLRETAEQIKLEIKSTELPEANDHKLDVMDFATPVSFVDVRSSAGDVKVDIIASGNYRHMAYQTGNQYVVEVMENKDDIETAAQGLDKEKEYTGHKVNFNFQDVPVRSVLSMIADASQFNIVVSDAVDGNVTLRLNEVPWDQALDVVLNIKKLDKRQEGNVVWVAPAKDIAEREQEALNALKEKEESEPLKTIMIQINYARAEEFATLLMGNSKNINTGGGSANSANGTRGMLSSRGSVSFDERTNTLLITDVPSKLVVIEELIQSLDVAVRQVQIESRIVIASDKFGDELGVKFGVTGSKQDRHGNILSTGGSLEALDDLNSVAIANRLNNPSGSGLPNFTPTTPGLGDRLNVNLPAVAGNASKWAFSILAADYLLDLELSALQTEGRGEVISTPRVVTTNQKEAFIKQGVQIPYEETAASPTGVPTISFKEAVMELSVTPLITPDDRVDLSLRITKNTIGELFNGVPSIDTREMETRVLVGSGQTIVLGGVYEHVKRTDKSKVPVLGNIPGLGALFRNKSVTNDKAELLVFITPTIIKESL
ncbi:MAG TPA: type IV pilus secretin PilQ [Gammaproteobacteria bacterium]|nr:type IV pilus secretin PilQ [Gammaproteobacteria bacterium]